MRVFSWPLHSAQDTQKRQGRADGKGVVRTGLEWSFQTLSRFIPFYRVFVCESPCFSEAGSESVNGAIPPARGLLQKGV